MQWYKRAFLEPEDIARLDAANEYRPSGDLQRIWGTAPLGTMDLLREKSRELIQVIPTRESVIEDVVRSVAKGDESRVRKFLEKDERASALLDELERLVLADDEVVPRWKKADEKERTVEELISLCQESELEWGNEREDHDDKRLP